MSDFIFDDYFTDSEHLYRVQVRRTPDRERVEYIVSSGHWSHIAQPRADYDAQGFGNLIRYVVNVSSPWTLTSESTYQTDDFGWRIWRAVDYRHIGACECGAAKCKTTHSLWCPARG